MLVLDWSILTGNAVAYRSFDDHFTFYALFFDISWVEHEVL